MGLVRLAVSVMMFGNSVPKQVYFFVVNQIPVVYNVS